MVSRETLIIEANRTGFRAEILEKVIRLIDLLNSFVKNDFLKTRIALKGGTALNLFHFDLPRLSVDIDLNYIGNIDRESMLADKPKIIAEIDKICRDKKYQSIRQPKEHAGGKWKLSYNSVLNPRGQLEIDLNFISRVPLWEINWLNSIEIGPFQARSIPVLDYHDLIGGKLSALFSRHKSRDLFDTHTIFSHLNKINLKKAKLAFIIYGAASKADIRNASLQQINFDNNELKNMLLPVIRKDVLLKTKNVKQWAQSLINHCKKNCSSIISFDHNERQFLTNLIEHGEITPHLIVKEKHLIEVINQHPILRWKAINVRKHINK